VTLHLQKSLDLADGEVLPVSERHQLVKGADQLEGIAEDFSFVEALAGAGDDLGEQVQRVDVLEDVGLLVGDEHHVQLIQRLVDKSDIVLLDGCVLGAGVGRLREGREEGFDARPLDVVEGPREDGLAAAGADGRSKNNLSMVLSAFGENAKRQGQGYHFDCSLGWAEGRGLSAVQRFRAASTLGAGHWHGELAHCGRVWSIWPNAGRGADS
jgi:hypothetical protein